MKKHILIVDDNKTSLASAKATLAEGYKTTAVTSGAQALKFLENNDCDLILLDINMPEMDGFEVMEKIKQNPQRADIPIIFLTAEIDPQTENRCLEAGAMDFIAKPFVKSVMRSRISRIIEIDDLHRNLEGQLEERAKHISDIKEMMIMGLATMVESRDNGTGGHIRRTTGIVEMFTKKLKAANMGFSEDFLEKVDRSAAMHDLGKIAVDDCVLRKHEKFNEYEYNEMKKHPAEGAKIIREILGGVEEESFVKIAENVAHYHHERWDGTGYPEGLVGEAIPVEARIMALADVFDALVSERCYKRPFSFDEAIEIITGLVGKDFDPSLGNIFITCQKDLEKLYDDFFAEDEK